MPPARTPTPPPRLTSELNRQLLASGELRKIESHLLHLLQSTGWTAELRARCTHELREGGVQNFQELLGAVQAAAVATVPEEVVVEVVGEIARIVRGVVEA